MPNQPRRMCSYPGCGTLVDRGRCQAHPYSTRPRDRSAGHRMEYGSEWYAQRARFLRQHPICQIQRKCRGAQATEVDHIVPLAAGGSRSDRNLQAACKPCHSSKTARQDTARDSGGRFHARHAPAVH